MTKDIDENAVKNSELIFLEGYLWDEGEPKTAFNKAISISEIKQQCHCQINFVLTAIKKVFCIW